MNLVFHAKLKVGATQLATLIATQGVRRCLAPRATDPGLHQSSSHALSLTSPLAANVPVDSCTAPRRHGRQPTNQKTPRTEGLAHTCRAILHGRTGQSRFEVDDRRTRGIPSAPQMEVPWSISSTPFCARPFFPFLKKLPSFLNITSGPNLTSELTTKRFFATDATVTLETPAFVLQLYTFLSSSSETLLRAFASSDRTHTPRLEGVKGEGRGGGRVGSLVPAAPVTALVVDTNLALFPCWSHTHIAQKREVCMNHMPLVCNNATRRKSTLSQESPLYPVVPKQSE